MSLSCGRLLLPWGRQVRMTLGIRIKALFLDWLFICAYLIILLLVAMTVFLVALDGIPDFTHGQAQWMATLTSVVPIIVIFSIMEGSPPFGSWGKRKTKLLVSYRGRALQRSVLRNSLKFLPWQLGHMSTINGIYRGFDHLSSAICLALSVILITSYIGMALRRKDGRHLADLIAGSRVVKSP